MTSHIFFSGHKIFDPPLRWRSNVSTNQKLLKTRLVKHSLIKSHCLWCNFEMTLRWRLVPRPKCDRNKSSIPEKRFEQFFLCRTLNSGSSSHKSWNFPEEQISNKYHKLAHNQVLICVLVLLDIHRGFLKAFWTTKY